MELSMRWFLGILSLICGGAAILLLLVALSKDGNDMHFIGSGVFLTAFVVCAGLVGVMVRLEQIRDRR
jgi:hypothetical protein